jgi:hypothetical protein
MKKLIYTLVILAFAVSLNAQWQQFSNGIGIYNIRSFLLNGSNLFAGSEGGNSGPGNGVYFSNTYGASWTYIGLSPYNVNCLAQSGTNIFAGTRTAGIFLSTNNGGSWTAVNNGITTLRVDAIAVIGTTILAGTNEGGGAFRSTNNGTSWTPSGLSGLGVFSFAVNGSNLFAGTNTGIFLSTNNGVSWTQTSPPPVWVRSIVISGTKIFAAGDGGGAYLSTNNGANWTLINSGLPNVQVAVLAVSGTNLFAGINGQYGVYLSTNNGTTWIARNEGFSGGAPNTLAFVIVNNYYLYAGTSSQVWRRPLSEFIGIKQISEIIPSAYSLSQNYPNPFNPETNIKFAIPKNEFVKITVFDMLGKELETLVNEQLAPGTYETNWNASNYPSGVYFYKLSAGDFSETRKMLLLK